MGAVTKLILLLGVAVSWSAAWEALPNIPANRRAEYYLLHDDGAYKYGYDTGSGASHVAQADASNEVRGSYSYESPEGPVQLIYTAGRGGFVPGSSSLPAVQSTKSAVHSAQVASHSISKSHGTSSAVQSSSSSISSDYDENADASYAFDFDTNEYKRQEASDAKGNVRGRYSYSGKDGNNVAVSYSAGAGKGFVVESHEGLSSPVQIATAYRAPVTSSFVPAVAPKPYSGPLADISSTGPNQDGSYSFAYSTGDHDRQESGDASGLVRGRYSFVANDGLRRAVDYKAGSLLGFVPTGDGIAPPVPVPAVQAYTATPAIVQPINSYRVQSSHSQQDEAPGDASYAFAYQAVDHARQESSDPAGNVQGEYSYTAPDGLSRTVKYTAGAEKGFVAEQAQSAGHSTSSSYSARPAVSTNVFASQHAVATKQAIDNAASVGNADGSYSFAYQTNDHARSESSDQSGNVRGTFSFQADDGVSRTVNYEAGANKGFIAQGAHLPTPPPASSGHAIVAAKNNFYIPPAAPAWKAPSVSSVSSSGPVDGSYSFSYDAGQSARQESADTAGNVRGQYSFTADDGVSRSVQYEAGANKGFIAQGAHLPKNNAQGSTVAVSRGSVITAPAVSSSSSFSATQQNKAGDASYSYSYQTDSSGKTESSDSRGNVVGTFSFVGGDGQSRTLNYVAGPETGFVAQGAHLPVAPTLPVSHQSTSIVAAKTSNSIANANVGSHNYAANKQTTSWSTPTSSFVLHKYLPPESSQKFGYILDTRV